MDYISTRGSAPALDFAGPRLPPRFDGGLYLPREWPVLEGRDRGDGRPALCRTCREDHAAFVGDSLTSERCWTSPALPMAVSPQGGHAAQAARRAAVAAGTVPRPDTRLQGRGAPAARPAVRGILARGTQNLTIVVPPRAIRLGGDRCRGGRAKVDVFMLHPRVGSATSSAARYDGAGAQCPQHRHRRHLRRCPGHGEADVQRFRHDGAFQHRRSQFDQLGALMAQVVYYFAAGLQLGAPHARSPSRCRPAISATFSPAMSRRRWACRSSG